MVHGTFSRAHTAFGSLPREFVEALYRHYQGRVFAFDHYTLSEDPRQNIESLLQRIPDGASLDLDVICHSRGGLVSRVLAERQAELSLGSRSLAVNKIVFVAAPNAGTLLTDTRHLGDLIDSYTNILNFFPDNGVTEVLQAVITVMKQLAVGAAKGLSGLESMLPGGPFLTDWLNRGPKGAELYYAIASDYEPTQPGLLSWAKDRLVGRVFDHAENDLIVPTLGVYRGNGSDLFPIADHYVFPPAAGIQHGGYFSDSATQQQIMAWLSA
jgi:pimeloyl-ACP methyl ester carboxylesterase